MTKLDLINKVAETGLTKKQAQAAVEAVVEGIKEALSKGEKVQLVGFGTFVAKKKAAREGRNPQTGAPLRIPEKIVPSFRPGTELKELVSKVKL